MKRYKNPRFKNYTGDSKNDGIDGCCPPSIAIINGIRYSRREEAITQTRVLRAPSNSIDHSFTAGKFCRLGG